MQVGKLTTNNVGRILNIVELLTKICGRAEGSDRIGEVISEPREGITRNTYSRGRCPEGIILIKKSEKGRRNEKAWVHSNSYKSMGIHSWCLSPDRGT